MKKTVIISMIALVVAIAVAVVGVIGFTPNDPPPEVDISARNVIIMIGDGMGPNHIEAAKIYMGLEKLNMETLPYQGLVNTTSMGGDVTDSAAAATALATGYKTYNGMVGMYTDFSILQNVTEYAKTTGRKTGLVATKAVTDATPAGFSAHALNRGFSEAIAKQQVELELDTLMGAGRETFLQYEATLTSKGYAFPSTLSELNASTSDKIYAIYDSVSPDSEINLEALTAKTLATLDNEKGFFAMIEGSKIDSKAHSNDMEAMVKELISFDNAIKLVIDYIKDNPDTILIVTADHETGDLHLPEERTKANLTNDLFKSTGHTRTRVKYFAIGNGTETLPKEIDNTDIAKFLFKALA